MAFIDKIKEQAKQNKKRIVLPESMDRRTFEAAAEVLKDGIADLIIIGSKEEVEKNSEGLDITGATIVDPATNPKTAEYIDLLVELRKAKGMTKEAATDLLMKEYMFYACIMVKAGDADGVVSGACHSTANTLKPALQIIKTKPGKNIVASCFILVRESATGGNTVLAMGDCAINIKPNEDELAEIAIDCAECAKIFGIDPKIAFLSYSTYGSGAGEDVDKMRNAAQKAKDLAPDLLIAGEMQFDAAVSPRVARTKCPGDPVAGSANTFIFPDINAGNIGYKIAQRLGGFDAYGPIMLGLNAPINDLSRGCNASEVYSMAIVTAALA